jgi:hypothetical protein
MTEVIRNVKAKIMDVLPECIFEASKCWSWKTNYLGANEVSSRAFICVGECGSAWPRIKALMKAVQLVAEALSIILARYCTVLAIKSLLRCPGQLCHAKISSLTHRAPFVGPANNN